MYSLQEDEQGGALGAHDGPSGEVRPTLPAWIEGTDRLVCELIRDGKDYAQIGKVLNLETQTVTNRVSLLRKRARAMKKNSKLFL